MIADVCEQQDIADSPTPLPGYKGRAAARPNGSDIGMWLSELVV